MVLAKNPEVGPETTTLKQDPGTPEDISMLETLVEPSKTIKVEPNAEANGEPVTYKVSPSK